MVTDRKGKVMFSKASVCSQRGVMPSTRSLPGERESLVPVPSTGIGYPWGRVYPTAPSLSPEWRLLLRSVCILLEYLLKDGSALIFTTRNEVAKVMFLQMSVCPWGCIPA